MAGEAPHLRLGGVHERAERDTVTATCVGEEGGEIVHGPATILGNQIAAGSDYQHMDRRMDCTDARTAISARLDGEALPTAVPGVDAHLRTCADCREYEAAASMMHRRLRLRPAEPVPDLSASIVAGPAASFSVKVIGSPIG